VSMRWQGTAPEFHSRLKPEEFPTVAALHARWMEDDALLMAFVARLTDESLNTDLEYSPGDIDLIVFLNEHRR
jgi:hypothetical protein